MLPLRDLDFRRGVDNTGRVVVDLANNQVGVDIRQQGQTLVVEFLKTSLPEGLRRRLDVTDFGTPVQTVTTTQSGDRVRMVIEPRGIGSTAPTRATTSLWWKFGRRKWTRPN